MVEKIIHLRQHYHFGPMKIMMYLKRYHDVEISTSGVWRILKRLGLNRLPACPPPSATSATPGARNATRSRDQAITSKSMRFPSGGFQSGLRLVRSEHPDPQTVSAYGFGQAMHTNRQGPIPVTKSGYRLT